MPVLNHIHKYIASVLGGEKIRRDENGNKKLIKTAGYPIYKCTLDGCSHFAPRSAVLGNRTICWRCEKEMFMKTYNLNEVRPHHRECRRKAA